MGHCDRYASLKRSDEGITRGIRLWKSFCDEPNKVVIDGLKVSNLEITDGVKDVDDQKTNKIK